MNFDALIDRNGTGALKWNAPHAEGLSDVIPLWVADMDFAPPEAVAEALRSRIAHPIFGYTNPDPTYFEALSGWYRSRYGAEVEARDFLIGPGVVPSLGIAVRTFCEKGEGVLIMPPVYYPFAEIVRDNDRVAVEAPLDAADPFRMRFDPAAAGQALREASLRGVKVRMLFFCSPHNPGGIVWTREELSSVIAFAKEHDLLVISDEIHGDLVYTPRRFVSLSAFPGADERTIVISAPNKTFNLAGLHLSHFVVRDGGLRTTLKRGIAAAGYSQPNVLSLAAAQAAYEQGAAWLDELCAYLRANAEFAVDFVNAKIPGARTSMPEGTYLLWVDAARLLAEKGLTDDKELVARLTAEARVRLTAGSIFVSEGTGFVRINVASPRALLAEGLERFAAWAERK